MRGLPLTLALTTILLLTIPMQAVIADPGGHHDKPDYTPTVNHEYSRDGEGEDRNGATSFFKLHTHPHSLKVRQGENVSVAITLKVKGGGEECSKQDRFNETVHLSFSWIRRTPSDVSYSFQPASIGRGDFSILTLATHPDSTIGKFPFYIHGTLGDHTESMRMLLKIRPNNMHPPPPPPPQQPYFAISSNPRNLAATAGQSASSTVTVTGFNNFNSPVGLTIDWEDEAPAGVIVAFNPATVTPNATSSLTLQTSASSPAGTHDFNVVGTSGSMNVPSEDMSLTISSSPPPPAGDFAFGSIPDQTIHASESARFNITLTPFGDFDQTVTLSVSPAALSGATIELDKLSTTLPATVHLTVNTTSSISESIYTFTITGTGGGRTHTQTARLTVLPAIITPPVSQEFPWFWLAIAAILIIGVATAVALKIRRKPLAAPTSIPPT